MKLDDLKVIITGGAKGMGYHFACRLLEAGANVTVGDIDEEALKLLPSEVHRQRLDVSAHAECEAFVKWAQDEMRGLNSLICNAGIIRDGLLVKRDRRTGDVHRLGLDALRAVIDVNLLGATVMVREVAAAMIARDEPGVIVNISSISRHGNRGQTSYVASKAALAANTVTWAREFQRHGIRVGAVAPGMVETPMTQSMRPETLDAITAQIPVGRIGQPEDIWLGVKFVLECEYFNGRTIDIDGGFSF